MPITTSRLPGYPSVGSEWTLLQTFADAAGGDIVSFDTGVMGTTYDLYKIIGLLQNSSGGNVNVYSRVNNDSAASYSTTEHSDTVVQTVAGATAFHLSFFGASPYQFEFIITGKTTGAFQYPLLNGSCAGTVSGAAFLAINGIKLVTIPTVNRISLYTDANCTGKMKLFGMNLT